MKNILYNIEEKLYRAGKPLPGQEKNFAEH